MVKGQGARLGPAASRRPQDQDLQRAFDAQLAHCASLVSQAQAMVKQRRKEEEHKMTAMADSQMSDLAAARTALREADKRLARVEATVPEMRNAAQKAFQEANDLVQEAEEGSIDID